MNHYCTTCQHWAPGPASHGQCAVHGIETYWQHSCSQHSDLVPQPPAQQQSQCRGDTAPVRAVQSAYNILLCGACHVPLRTPQVCWKCGRGQVWP